MKCLGCEKVDVPGAMPETLDMVRPLHDLIEKAPLCEKCRAGLQALADLDLGAWTIELGGGDVEAGGR